MKTGILAAALLMAANLSACSSPPKPVQPEGERVPVNHFVPVPEPQSTEQAAAAGAAEQRTPQAADAEQSQKPGSQSARSKSKAKKGNK